MEFGYKISKTTKRVSLGKDISRLVSRGDGEQLEISFLEMLMSDEIGRASCRERVC